MKRIIKKQLLYSLIIPYILIISVTLMGYVCLYHISMERIKENHIEINNTAVNKLIREIDYGIKDVVQLSNNIGISNEISKLASIDLPMNYQDKYDIAILSKELDKRNSYTHFIEGRYIYFKEGNFIISNRYYYVPDVIYEEFHKREGADIKKWYQELTGYFPMGKITFIGGKLAYIITPLQEESCNIITLLNTDRLNILIQDYEKMQQANLYILNEEGEVLLGLENKNEKEQLLDMKKLQEIFKEDAANMNQEVELNNKGYFVIKKSSKESGLQYLSFISKESLTYQTKHIFILLGTMVVIFISLLLVGVVLIKKNYTSIINLIKKLEAIGFSKDNRIKEDKQVVYTEVGYIGSILDMLQKDIHNQEEIVVENIISKAINGIVERKILLDNRFIVGIIEPIVKPETEKQEKKMNEFIIYNVLSEIFKGYAKVYVITLDNVYAVVMDLGEILQEGGVEYIITQLERGKRFLEKYMQIKCTISLSNVYIGIKKLYLAYQEAKRGIEYKIVLGSERIIYCIGDNEQTENYQYSMEMEFQLINYIKSGELNKAMRTIDYLFDMNFLESSLSIDGAKCFIIDLYSTLIKVAKENKITIDLMPSELLKKLDTIDEMKKAMKAIIEKICEAVETRKKINTGNKGDAIIAYIWENYADVNLNVANIADTFGFNSSYLSRFFKEQTGENLLMYINKYRVEKVKELLIGTNLTLNEIALQSGFINSVAVIRIFKKYVGITPTEYRIINKKIG